MTFGWHPREHRKALDGMLSLTLEERGAYNTCLDLIYDRQGPIPDDMRWLAGWMGVSSKKWGKIRAALIVKGKLFEVNLNGTPSLMNQRAAIELENQSKLARKLRENGAKGGAKRCENETKANENNVEAQAPAQAGLKLKTKTQTVEEDSEANASGGEPPTPSQKAWTDAKALLVAQGGMSMEAAGKFFGKLLSQHRLDAADLLGAIGEATANGTSDPQGYLTKAAQARNRRKAEGVPAKRVSWV